MDTYADRQITSRVSCWASPRSLIISVAALTVVLITQDAGAQYHTYSQMVAEIQAAETNYPGICKSYNLGNSVQGRGLWALRISDNMPDQEDEPEFKFISSMHGDEVTGLELCLYLIDHLTTNYGTDPRITNIVDSIDIWIMPLMNPDGFVAVQRYNANGVDLNRNFPDPFSSPNNTPTGRQPETGVIMNWAFAESFTLSANYHGGTMVVNYPYDNNADSASVYTTSPDDDLFIEISERYTWENQPMWNGPFFHGITNGAEWYAIDGGMQDWAYRYMGTNEVTIEVSTVKKPPISQIPTFWNDNREAMLVYIESVLIGARGVVTDGNSAAPLDATISVRGRGQDVYTDPDVGDYHRMLLPGTYEATAAAAGYETLTHPSIVVNSGNATRWDVAMGPATTVLYPNGAESLSSGSPAAVSWSGNAGANFQVQYAANANDVSIDFDGFETGVLSGNYNSGGHQPWSVTSSDAYTGSFAARSGAIGNNQVSWIYRTVNGADISFWYRVSSESGGDVLTFYLDNQVEFQASGDTGWTYYSTTRTAGNHSLLLEYAKDAGGTSGSDTVWIDDLEVGVDNRIWTDIVTQTAVGATTAQWVPGTPGTTYKTRIRVKNADGSYGGWDESDDVFSVVEGTGEIPTLSEWGMVVMTLLALVTGTHVFRRKSRPAFGPQEIA